MRTLQHLLVAFSLGLSAPMAYAAKIPLQNIDQDDFKKIVGDFSANFTHTSVSGASSLGKIFGIELGVVGGQTNTDEINRLANEVPGAQADADKIYHAALLGVVSVPFGITAEVGLLPKVGTEEFKYNQFSAALKWTPTELFWELPLSLAVKAHVTKSDIEFKQTISGVPTTFDYENTVTGLTLLASKNFVIVEPYAGFGLVSGDGKMDVSGSTTVFDTNYVTSQSASGKKSGTMWMVGAELKLLVLKLGVEYSNLFDTSRYSGKVSFYF